MLLKEGMMSHIGKGLGAEIIHTPELGRPLRCSGHQALCDLQRWPGGPGNLPPLPVASACASLPQRPSSDPPAAAALPASASAPRFAFHTGAWLFSVSPGSAAPGQLAEGKWKRTVITRVSPAIWIKNKNAEGKRETKKKSPWYLRWQ